MDSISALRETITRAVSPGATSHHVQDLFDALATQRPSLLKLLHVDPRNSHEQQEIQSGKITIGGKKVAVNADFIRQVLFLAQQLECSEKAIAEILYSVMSEYPNMDSKEYLEAVVARFHSNRRNLVESLQLLFNAAEQGESPTAGPALRRICSFIYTELVPGSQTSLGGQTTLPYKMFKELEGMDAMLLKALVAKRNAGSVTVPPSAQSPGMLSSDTLESRYNSIKYERRGLADAFCYLARLGCLSSNEIKLVVEWLLANPNHSITFYILTAFLNAFNPSDPNSHIAQFRSKFASDASLVTFMSQKLSPGTTWKDQGLKSTLILKWTLFLTEVRRREPSYEHRSGFKTEELETQIWNAVQGDTFDYLALAVLQLQRPLGEHLVSSLATIHDLSPEQVEQREVPDRDFTLIALQAFDVLVRSLIVHASSELRKIKQRQEDLVHANARTERTKGGGIRFTSTIRTDAENHVVPPRNDIAMLYAFVGLLYGALPNESGIQYWGAAPSKEPQEMSYLERCENENHKLLPFLQWAVWSTSMQDYATMTALYDMLSGLAKGQFCSELAYNFLARGGGEVVANFLPGSSSGGQTISWTIIFGLLESWGTLSAPPRGPANPAPLGQVPGGFGTFSVVPQQYTAPQHIINSKDVLLAQAFLRLLSTVVAYSDAVRMAISGHIQFRAIPTLVALIPLGVPLELKGAIFEALSAFCTPGAGAPGIEICKAVWSLMERYEVINVRAPHGGAFTSSLSAVKGVEIELEEIEAVHRLYPSTIPFLKLLATLIHTSKRIPLSKRISDAESLNTIPENLGQPYRLPGIAPFVSFVIDNVFARIPNREYSRPSDRWQTNDLCLCFIERSLASFDLETLPSLLEEVPLQPEALLPILIHPGYEITERLLTSSPLQASILSYIVEGVEGFERNYAEEEPYYRSTIVRVLRVVYRILEIQDLFLDVLVPLLTDLNLSPVIGNPHPRSYYTKFDQSLSFTPDYAPAIAAYLTFTAYQELVLLSVKILSKLSTSPFFTNLSLLIEKSRESERVLVGFSKLIAAGASDDVRDAEAFAEQATGAGAADFSDVDLTQAIKVAALDFLLQNTESKQPYPNLAHLLLFGGTSAKYQIQDPHALGAKRTSVHVLIHLINSGIPRLRGKGKAHERHLQDVEPLFLSQPDLAERCYRIIYQLCMHRQTSESTTRYLRTREDFFARQLNAIPFQIPSSIREAYIQLQYPDGEAVTTTVPVLTSFLRLRSWIFDLVALELHLLTNKNHLKAVTDLLDILFGIPGFEDETYHDENFSATVHTGQSHMRVIEFLKSLMFDWQDSLKVEPLDLQFLASLNLLTCLRTDAQGCDVVDRNAVIGLLTSARRALRSQGAIVNNAQSDQLNKEINYILESCAVENHRREVTSAVSTSYEAWRRLLEMALTKCFDRLPRDSRENMLFELLHILPPAISRTDIDESTAILLAETTLSSICKLREDRRHQVIIQSAGGDAEAGVLPAERLYSILRSILEGILENNRVELVRGNLYASLINFIHLVASTRTQSEPTADAPRPTQLPASSFFPNNSRIGTLVPVSSIHHGATNPNAYLESGSLNVIKPVLERLVTVISRDAIDGTEVWKTVAFMLLDAIVQLSGTEKQHAILAPLTKHGILGNFVQSIRDSDGRLQAVLKPDPDDMNALYVYEAKMSLFIRMSQTRAGAEKLLDSRILVTLTKCDYLDARPEVDQSFIDQDSFLPSAIQRYHQLIMPALQLIDGMLATLGTRHKTLVHQSLEFLASHGTTIAILLKNETEYNTLALLDEIQLIVLLSQSVLPAVPKTEVVTANSGFGAIHASILTLSTRSLGRGQCFANIVAVLDSEIESARTPAFGFGSETRFELEVRRKERLLRRSIVAYIGTASDFTEPDLTLVLSPMTTTSRQSDRGHFSATIPTLGDAAEALNDLCGELGEAHKQITDISAEFASKEHIDVGNIREAVPDLPNAFLQDLDPSQKRALISEELERIRTSVRRDARILLDTTEMLLLALWRHLDYYTNPVTSLPPPTSTANNSGVLPNVSTSTLQALRFLTSPPDTSTIRTEMGRKLSAALSRLTVFINGAGSSSPAPTNDMSVEWANGGSTWQTPPAHLHGPDVVINEQILGLDGTKAGIMEWAGRKGFIEIMVRRIRDVTGMVNGAHSTEEGD